MDYNILLDVVSKLGYRLAMAGAETFRVEESVNRILAAYNLEAETFAIPNCLTISIKTHNRESMTRMRRIGQHGNDLDAVERYSNLSRRICAEVPSPDVALQWIDETDCSRVYHRFPIMLLGHFLGAFGFTIFFGGSLLDAFCGGLCGILVGLLSHFAERWHINQFFTTTVSSFGMTILAFMLGILLPSTNCTPIIVGTLMILVPGLLFTNAMRDIIFGDTNSGINRIVQVLMIAVAIALGAGTAWFLTSKLIALPTTDSIPTNSVWLQLLGAMIGCLGFTIIFNVHFPGGLLCMAGGVLTWAIYCLAVKCQLSPIVANFLAAIGAAIYSEIMARIRKCPAISYLVVSCFPLLPGAGVYFTTYCAVQGDIAGFASKGKETIIIAGALAVGILLVSTVFRLISMLKTKKTLS